MLDASHCLSGAFGLVALSFTEMLDAGSSHSGAGGSGASPFAPGESSGGPSVGAALGKLVKLGLFSGAVRFVAL